MKKSCRQSASVAVARLFVELLESREMLAGGSPLPPPTPVSAPLVNIVNLSLPAIDILPGSTRTVARMDMLTSGRTYARPTELIFVAALGSEALARNAYNFQLQVDTTGNGKWTTVATAQPNYYSDVLDFTSISQAIWVRQQPVHFQIVASFFYGLTGSVTDGSYFGIETAYASFVDLRGQQVPDYNVSYWGADPTLFRMQPASASIYEDQLPSAATVYVGTKGVSLLQFNVGFNQCNSLWFSFSAAQGTLAQGTNYVLTQDTNWDGIADYTTLGMVFGSQVYFFTNTANLGGHFNVKADIKGTKCADPRLQLNNVPNVVAIDNAGRILTVTNVNGQNPNGGQIQVWGWQNYATLYTVVANPQIFVSETPASPSNQVASVGSTVVLEKFTVQSTSPSVVTHMAISAATGDLAGCKSYALYANRKAIALGRVVTVNNNVKQVVFNFYQTIPAYTAVKFEVRAVVIGPPQNWCLQTQLVPGSVVARRLTSVQSDEIFINYSRQTFWEFSSSSGGLG